MDCKVILSPRALNDLEEIVRFIAVDRPNSASRFGHRLLREAEMTGRWPFAGRIVPEFKSATIRERIFRNIRIVFRVDESEARVVVLRFWHGARGRPDCDPPS